MIAHSTASRLLESDIGCGPFFIDNAFRLFGQPQDLGVIARRLSLSESNGTDNVDIVRVSEENRYRPLVRTSATPSLIKALMNKGMLVGVNYLHGEDRVGHFATVSSIDSRSIRLLDQSGIHTLSTSDFVSRWRSGFESYERWLIALQPPRPQPLNNAVLPLMHGRQQDPYAQQHGWHHDVF